MEKEKKYRNITTTIPVDIYNKIKELDIPISKLILIGYDTVTKQRQECEQLYDVLSKIYNKLLDIEELLKDSKASKS